jgi:hypothetical protein
MTWPRNNEAVYEEMLTTQTNYFITVLIAVANVGNVQKTEPSRKNIYWIRTITCTGIAGVTATFQTHVPAVVTTPARDFPSPIQANSG